MRALLLLCAAAGVAHADDTGYATLDRHDGASKLGAKLTYFSLRQQGQWARVDLAAQYVWAGGLGVYGAMPLAYLSDAGGTTSTSYGDLEVGGSFASATGLVLHVGLALPSSPTDDNRVLSTTAITHLNDLSQVLPGTLSLRTGIAYELRACQIFGRIELGIDVPLSSTDTSGSSLTSATLVHVDAAIGFDADDFTVAIESSNLAQLSNGSGNFEVVAATIRARTGDARPYLAAIVPLDGSSSEPAVAFVAGVDVRLP